MQHIGIFGGSFNPIHCGHIALAKEILRQTGLSGIWLMVSPQNPLKRQSDLLDDNERLLLARKALQHVAGIEACDFEFRLPRPSYTWNTLEALRKAYPEHQFSLIIGGDNWERFDRWYRADDIRQHYPLIVYPRRDASPASPAAPKAAGMSAPAPSILTHLPLFDVSSTEIRQRVKNGESIVGLVPDAIIDDVKRLYA